MPATNNVTLVGLSDEAMELIERLLVGFGEDHALWVEENSGEARGDEADVALADKVYGELRSAKETISIHVGVGVTDDVREAMGAKLRRPATAKTKAKPKQPKPETEAKKIAGKMAKAARKAAENG